MGPDIEVGLPGLPGADAVSAELAAERDRAHTALYALGERIKELTALHETARLLDDDRLGVRDLLERIAALIPPAFQFPDITEASVRYGDIVVRTPAFAETPWTLEGAFATRDGVCGAVQAHYRELRPVAAEGPFLAEERHLLNSLADMLASALDRRQAEAALLASDERLRLAHDRAQLLLEITNAVVCERDLHSLLDVVSRLLLEKIKHHFASIDLWEPEQQQLRRYKLVFPDGRGAVREGAVVRPNSPAVLAFEQNQTMIFRWSDVLALGEPSVSVMTVEGLRAVCCLPLTTARGRYGTLTFGKPEDVPFPADEVVLLEQVARQLALAFENALTFQQAERYRQESQAQRDRLRLLLDVNNKLLAQPESHSLRLSVLADARRVVAHDCAALILHDPDTNELRVEAATYYDHRGVLEPKLVVPRGHALSTIAFEERRTCTFTEADLAAVDDERGMKLRAAGMRSVCAIPLAMGRRVLGTLTIGRRSPDGFSAAEVELLTDVAGQVAIAVANTLAYQEISALKDRLTDEKLYLEDEISLQHDFTQIVGNSQALTNVLRQVSTVAPTDATVLLLGETGTGKELLARALHNGSRRNSQTFVRVNGAALPTGLIESELFGYEKGAFTGAAAAKVGRLELAHRGTLFLDEVGDLPLDVQPKLLRALQEQEFERLGSTRTQRADVRFVSATNRNLNEMVAAGTFRSDLYYRLSVFPIFVPPLRERREDIPLLVQHFVRKFTREIGRSITTIPSATMETLQRWSWPGNIRELENVIERAVIVTTGSVLQVPASAFDRASTLPPTKAVSLATGVAYRDGEREIILRALRDAKGIIGGPDGAAARLGLKRTTLHSKMRKLGIARPSF